MPLLEKTGTFSATTKNPQLGESNNGTPYLQLTFEADQGIIARRLYLSDAAWDYSMKTLKKAFSFDSDFENLAQLDNRECEIVTHYEKDQEGKDQIAVKWVNARKAPIMEADQQQSLAARLSRKAGIVKPEQIRTDAEGNEIPF